jgi:hypothetical protein
MGTTVIHKKYCIQSEMMVKIHIYFRVAFIFFSVIGFDFFPLSFFFLTWIILACNSYFSSLLNPVLKVVCLLRVSFVSFDLSF